MPISLHQDRTHLNALGIQARTSVVGAGRLYHRAPIHCHMVNSADLTRLEFCLWLSSPLTTGIVKKILNITRNKQKKHDKVLMMAKSKLNSIEALIDLQTSHEEFIRTLMEKDKYERMKENLRSENEEYKIMRLSSIKSKI